MKLNILKMPFSLSLFRPFSFLLLLGFSFIWAEAQSWATVPETELVFSSVKIPRAWQKFDERTDERPDKKSEEKIENALPSLFSLTRQLYNFQVQAQVLCFDAVKKATQLKENESKSKSKSKSEREKLIKTGMLTQLDEKLKTFHYTPRPFNQLKVMLQEDEEWTFEIQTLKGETDHVAQDFFTGNHELRFTLIHPSRFKGKIYSELKNQNITMKMKGEFLAEGIPHQIDLTITGELHLPSLMNSLGEIQKNLSFEGTVIQDDFVLTIKETQFLKEISLEGGERVDSLRVLENALIMQGDRYEMHKIKLKEELINGKAYQTRFWRIQGDFLKNGKNFAKLEFEEDLNKDGSGKVFQLVLIPHKETEKEDEDQWMILSWPL